MNSLEVIASCVPGHGHGVEGTVGRARAVDHGSRCDTDLWRDLATVMLIAGRFTGTQQRNVPQSGSAIGVEGVDAGVLAYHVQKVVRSLTRNADLRKVDRLAIHLAVHGVEADLPELRSIHVSGSEDHFTQICAGSRIVVVVSDHVNLTWRWARSWVNCNCARGMVSTASLVQKCCQQGNS